MSIAGQSFTSATRALGSSPPQAPAAEVLAASVPPVSFKKALTLEEKCKLEINNTLQKLKETLLMDLELRTLLNGTDRTKAIRLEDQPNLSLYIVALDNAQKAISAYKALLTKLGYVLETTPLAAASPQSPPAKIFKL